MTLPPSSVQQQQHHHHHPPLPPASPNITTGGQQQQQLQHPPLSQQSQDTTTTTSRSPANNNLYNDINDYFYHPSYPQQQQQQQVSHQSCWKVTTISISKCYYTTVSFLEELWDSTEVIFSRHANSSSNEQCLSYLLILGPIVVLGDTFQILDKSICFVLSGITLIPCAERLSYLTEQIAIHTNGTIGALCNATFGNAPELLISIAALRLGYYRVIQLTMLGSMITNMIFVFGVSCLIGGLRYQTQSLRIISGNVTIGMLIISTIASLIPATLVLSGQFLDVSTTTSTTTTIPSDKNGEQQTPTPHHHYNRYLLKRTIETITPTQEEVTLSRVNASVLIMIYICYIIFQLGTHKNEFDDDDNNNNNNNNDNTILIHERNNDINSVHHRVVAQPNKFCRRLFSSIVRRIKWFRTCSNKDELLTTTAATTKGNTVLPYTLTTPSVSPMGIRKKYSDHEPIHYYCNNDHDPLDYHDPIDDDDSVAMAEMVVLLNNSMTDTTITSPALHDGGHHRRRRRIVGQQQQNQQQQRSDSPATTMSKLNLSKSFDETQSQNNNNNSHHNNNNIHHQVDHLLLLDMSQRTTTTNQSHSVHHQAHINMEQQHQQSHQQYHQQQHNTINFTISNESIHPVAVLSLRISIVWLFIITLCVSAISDILVDTIDEFAFQLNLSQVFTSMIIIPFFSNVAEQVSAFIFAYKNEMDLVIGVTIGSAIQIATFVLPGSVLIGYIMDRSMTLYFHSYETVCLLVCTLIVASILQGGTTNWLVGAMLIGVYIMFAAGIWFHEIENLSVDTEELIDIKNE